MESNYKQEIESSRVGGLGSSDAAMVQSVARSGDLNGSSAQTRIAVMTGAIEKPDFPKTKAMLLGDEIEMKLYDSYREWFPEAISNPLYVSEAMSSEYGFNIMNHIDIEVVIKEDDDTQTLIWFECKASKLETEDVLKTYGSQLAWHWMLLREKANALGYGAQMFLLHYPTNGMFTADSYNLSKVQQIEIEEKDVTADIELLHAGLKVIAEGLPTFQYKQPEEIAAYNLPAETQEALVALKGKLDTIKKMEKEVEDFKSNMTVQMEHLYQEHGIKSIKCEAFSLTYVAPSESVSFDSNRFKKEQPEMYAQYNTKVSKRKGYVTIK